MDRRLTDYLPPVLREVTEFQAVNAANEPELRLAWEALDRVLDNQFLQSADQAGVAVWERELKLLPKDTDSLEARKARIKALWNLKLPYTLTWLRGWLAGVCGEQAECRVQDYTLTVRIPLRAKDRREDAGRFLEWAAPANLVLDISLQYNTHRVLGRYTHRQLAAYTQQQLKDEVLEHGG